MKRKMSFTEHMRFTLSSYTQNLAAYCTRVKLTKPEKSILADYMNGHAALQVLTAPMLMKMLQASNSKYQFKQAYALELIAINLGERDRDTLLKLFKESTLKKWLTEFSIMSRPMQQVYLDEFGVTVFEGSNLPTVQGGIDMSERVTEDKSTKNAPGKKVAKRTGKQVADDMKLLRETVASKSVEPKAVAVVAKDYQTHVRTQGDETERADSKPAAIDYFSAHVMLRTGERLQEMFDDMMNYHHENKVPSLFVEFAKSPLGAMMADFWWQTFEFAYVDFKDNDNTLCVSCKHFSIYISHDELTFVDKWDCGDISYTIPASSKQTLRLEQAEMFFATWDIKRLNKILQYLGFEMEDEFYAAGNIMSVNRVPAGPQMLLEMSKGDYPISWDGASFSFYQMLEHMRDGLRGCTVKMDNEELSVVIGGLEYAAVFVSDGPVKRFVMPVVDAKSFFKEYTDHMGFSDNAHELWVHGFVPSLNKERAVLRFEDDSEKTSEIIAYV